MSGIVTLTMNPCIDLNLEVDAISFDTPLRSVAERKRAGGKGINVSEALAVLGVPSVAVAPLGGHSGREFADLARSRFNEALVQLVPVQISCPTRTNTVITSASDGRHVKVNQQGPELSDQEVECVVKRLDGLVGKDSLLAICGSMTPGLSRSFYQHLIERFKSVGAYVVLDADGEAFHLGVQARPDLVKPNREELSMWALGGLADDAAFRKAVHLLVEQTNGICLATAGPNPAILASKREAWTARPVHVTGSPVGAGDCSLAGLISVLWQNGLSGQPGPEALKQALACGSASAAKKDTEGLDRGTVERLAAEMDEPQAIRLV